MKEENLLLALKLHPVTNLQPKKLKSCDWLSTDVPVTLNSTNWPFPVVNGVLLQQLKDRPYRNKKSKPDLSDLPEGLF
jgi:hypothetical protein